MANEERRWLTAAIREVLLPALYAQGFKDVALTDEQKKSELRTGFPFGRQRRARESGFDVLEIQMEKYGSPSFGISTGVVPLAGINHVVGHVAAADVWSGHLPQHYVLYSVPLIGRGFSLWHWLGRRVTQADVVNYVRQITTSVIPEIEGALREGRCGKHVKVMGG